jgi:hypothetical protein
VKYGVGFRRADGTSGTVWPGNGVLAIENSATDFRAQVFRQGLGTNRVQYMDLYVGDSVSKNRVTVDVGVRYDRQWGRALPSTTNPNPAFPDLVPGLAFAGYDSPFTWNNISPRAGVTYALDDARRSIVQLPRRWARSRAVDRRAGTGFSNLFHPQGAAAVRDRPPNLSRADRCSRRHHRVHRRTGCSSNKSSTCPCR